MRVTRQSGIVAAVVALLVLGGLGVVARDHTDVPSTRVAGGAFPGWLAFAFLALALVLMVLRPVRRDKSTLARRRTPIIGLLVLAATAWLFSHLSRHRVRELPVKIGDHAVAGDHAAHPPLSVGTVGIAVMAVLAGLIAVLLMVRAGRAAAAARSPQPDEPDDATLAEAVASARTALAEPGDPRERVIACYAAMERSLAERGVTRGATETALELLSRASAGGGEIDAEAARSLVDAFGLARYSRRPVTEALAEQADQALARIERSLHVLGRR